MKNQPAWKTEFSKWKTMFRNMPVKYKIILLIAILLISVSAITHKFGPYAGKVVDMETGAPLEGAAVLINFRTDGIDTSGAYAGAIETATNSKGEFRISAKRFFVFYPLHQWNPNGYVIIFKPGYGVYPDHDDVSPIFMPNGTMPEKQHVTFKLPKLKTVSERKYNLMGVWSFGSVPDRKAKNLLMLIGEERKNIGLKD